MPRGLDPGDASSEAVAAGLHDPPLRPLVRDLAGSPSGIWVRCTSSSMEPTIRSGDRVRIEACPRIRIGDVVLFQTPNAYVLHRVVLPIPGTSRFLHIGDAGSTDGPEIAHRDQVIGRAALPRRLPDAATCLAGIRRLVRALRSRLHV